MLLDQKRTQRIVKITAVLTSLAFGGIALVVVLAIFFGVGMGGGGSDPAKERISQAQDRVKAEPTNAAAWDQLATAQYVAGHKKEAIEASQKSISLAPHDYARTQTLAQMYSDSQQHQKAMDVISAFIDKNPDSAEAYLQLGGAAQTAGKTQIARLAYQRFLQLDPHNPSAGQVRQQLKTLAPPGSPTVSSSPKAAAPRR